MLFAHSADTKKNIPAQEYDDHVHGVLSHAFSSAKEAARFAVHDGKSLREVARYAAEYHDLGKLDAENQSVLSGEVRANRLPVQHTDAGTACLLNEVGSTPSAVLVRSHHIGLPDFVEEQNRSVESVLRDDEVRIKVDQSLHQLIALHRQVMDGPTCSEVIDSNIAGDSSLFFRIALSCLVDGDHSDTAMHYDEYPAIENVIDLRAEERLVTLDKYVGMLSKNKDERSLLRAEMYNTCRNAIVDVGISSCDSPVGTGKTTAVMAHLLVQAQKRGLRRIIVVLPYTNIITQSVEVYRKALVLPGENPEEVVAELHHRADFQDVHTRYLTGLWKAPIIVTTAVTFFETLASNTPATLRRLHNLPGSAVFVDESHAALPAKLLPLAWQWIKGFAREWSCYWVLASGSLNRFWNISEFDKNPPVVPEILPDDLRNRLSIFEKNRVIYRYKQEVQNAEELVSWVTSLPGPRIVILNTVQSAAALALEYAHKCGREAVEHLSTALMPKDRAKVLLRVKSRLDNSKNEKDKDWTLFATSCVEAGMDISFRTGVREIGSLVSLLQTAGRVNRHGYNDDAEVWTIRLAENGLLKHNQGLKDATKVLQEYCDTGVNIEPDLCTEALKREIRMAGNFRDELSHYENDMRFHKVEKEFRVINSDTRLAVVDKELAHRIENYESVSWRDIQQGSVQIWAYKIEQLKIPEFQGRYNIYQWTYQYDDFIGYMAGVIPIIKLNQFNGAII
jgi:hypothetical protein